MSLQAGTTTLLMALAAVSTLGCGRMRPPAPVPANSAFFIRCTEPSPHARSLGLIDKHVAKTKVAFSAMSNTTGGIAEPAHLYSKVELEGRLTGTETAIAALMKSLLADFEAIVAETGAKIIGARLEEVGADQGRRHHLEFNYEANGVRGTVRVHAEAPPDEKGVEKVFRLTMKFEEMFP